MDKSLILNRIKSHYNLRSSADLARFLEIKPSTLGSWYQRNSVDFDIVFAKCEDMDKNYLITGQNAKVSEASDTFLLNSDKRIKDKQLIPLYSTNASAGLVQILQDHHNVLDNLYIPNLPKCDGAIHITGDSMYPLLKSGDIVIYKRIKDIANGIVWGEMYLLNYLRDGDDYTVVKYIKKSDLGPEYVKLVSQNQHHEPIDILLSSINALALIKASIRFNSMN